MIEKPILEDISKIVKLGHHIFDETTRYELDQSCAWVKDLFNELEEEVDREESEYKSGNINCQLSLKRKSGKPFADHLLVRGKIQTNYMAPCIRCLKLTDQEVDAEFQVCFIPHHLENEPEFEELDDIFTENEEFSLYYHEKGNADIAEMVHENLFMNIEHFPLHDENCLGLCSECGQDLNVETCKHQKNQ
ncbi:MAG: DUF177 domain-containing protein [Bacteriovoracaceae bacterium]|nr:DUF177 domain-containing protein [Bacteriovoracaceae bacterium]